MPARDTLPSVAVIGSGLAGLSVSYMLSTITNDANENAFDVHIYEKAASVGMDAASIELPAVGSRMDVPMRSFFPSYYPLMTALYDHLSIPYAWTESSMSYLKHSNVIADPAVAAPIPQSFPFSLRSTSNSFPSDSSRPSARPKADSVYFSFFSYRIPFLRNTIPVPDIWTRNPLDLLGSLFRAIGIAWDFGRLLVIAKWALARGQLLTYRYGQVREDSPFADMTLGRFFREYGFGRGFVEVFMVLLSGACTCSFSTLAEYPAAVILEYVGRSFPFGRMSFVTCGIGEVCARLSAPVKNVHVNSTIESVTRLNNRKLVVRTTDGRSGEYDYVIFATQANQAVKILSQSIKAQTALSGPGGLSLHLEEQKRTLERFRYERSLVVCHTDASLLPDDSRLWRCLNFAHAERCVGLERVFDLDISDDDSIDDDTSTNSCSTTTFGYDPRDVAMCTHVSTPAVGWNTAAAREGMPARAEKGEIAMSVQKGKAPFLQTTNPIVMPRAAKILSTTWFERVCVSVESMRGLDELDDAQGLGGVYFVGSFAYGGVPLLEGCVASAWRVTLRILERRLGREERSATGEKRWWWEEVEAGDGKVADEEGPRFVVERVKEAGLMFGIEPPGPPTIAWTDWQFFGLIGVIATVVAVGVVLSVLVRG
ncbi:hypothetical protein BJ742DRAFT_793421 [Cladochytrium replicatum]|nr:hypothetical protein BJ742DRAFT_793421 [Cladochytrium replicatum]